MSAGLVTFVVALAAGMAAVGVTYRALKDWAFLVGTLAFGTVVYAATQVGVLNP